MKGVGIVSGPVIKTPGVVNHQLMHVSDWFSTLTHLAGGSPYGTDGFDMWKSITQNVESPRKVCMREHSSLAKCKLKDNSLTKCMLERSSLVECVLKNSSLVKCVLQNCLLVKSSV